MRKLLVAVSAVLMVGMGASAAQAQGTQKCPSPETIKFEAGGGGTFSGSQGGITVTNGGPNTVVFSVDTEIVIDRICVKAGTLAPVFQNFPTSDGHTGSLTIGGLTVSYNCPFPGAVTNMDMDAGNELVGPCTVTVTRTSGPGISHITFYTIPYNAPEAAVAPLVVAQGESAVSGGAAGGLAFTGVQLSLMLAILAGLIVAGTLAWTAGRRRAAKTD